MPASDLTMFNKGLSAVMIVGFFVLSFALISLFAFVPVSATSGTCSFCWVQATPATGDPGTGFNLTTMVSLPSSTGSNLYFVGVVTPNGEVYVWGYNAASAYNTNPLYTHLGTCTIPFGASGSLSESGIVSSCTGPNRAAWFEQTTGSNLLSLSSMESICSSGIASPRWTSIGVGSTAESGTYQVIACLTDATDPVFTTTTFSVTSPSTTTTTMMQTSGVPEFPIASLSFVLLVALLLPVVLIMGRKFRARPVL